jgi:aryl-alcohol dehydrogenase-like predicted oxidoreductase
MSITDSRRLGRSGVLVSPLTLGTMNFGTGANTDEAESIRIITAALDAGVTVLDTADAYTQGASEGVVGKALRGRRDDVFLATKFHNQMGDNPAHRGNSRRWIVRAVEDSLRRLQTDRIDLYQAHRPDPHTDLAETLGALDDLVTQGKILYYGTSVFPATTLVEAQWLAQRNGVTPPLTEQLPYSLLIRGAERDTFAVARQYGLGLLTYGPLAAGWLSGSYRLDCEQPESRRAGLIPGRFDVNLARNRRKLEAADALATLAEESGLRLIDLALGFALNHPAVSTVIVGPRTRGHLDSYLRAADTILDDEILDRIDEIVAPGTHFIERDTGALPAGLSPQARRRSRPILDREPLIGARA